MEAVKATGGRGGVAQGEEGDVMEVVVTDEEVDLPAEVWAHVASFLPVRELAGGGLPLSCRRLHDLCSLDTLWQSAFRQQWPPRLEGRTSSASSPQGKGWKQRFGERVRLARPWKEGRYRSHLTKVDMSAERLQLVDNKVFCSSNKASIDCYDWSTSELKLKYTAGDSKSNRSFLGFHYNPHTDLLVTGDHSSPALLALDGTTGEIKAEQTAHRHAHMWTAQSDDEKAVLGIYDTIQIWDLQANKLLLSTEGAHKHNDQIRSLLFLGNTLLTGGALGDNTVKVWDLRRPVKPVEEAEIDNGVWCMDFDGEKLAAGTFNDIHLWDLRHLLQSLATVRAHEGHINMVQFDTEKLVSGSNDKTIKVWDVDTLELWHTIEPSLGMVRMGQYHDNVLVAGGTEGKSVCAITFDTSEPARSSRPPAAKQPAPPQSLDLFP